MTIILIFIIFNIQQCINTPVDLHPIKDEVNGNEGIYWGVDYPWPLYDRDVSKSCMINLKGIPLFQLPEMRTLLESIPLIRACLYLYQ